MVTKRSWATVVVAASEPARAQPSRPIRILWFIVESLMLLLLVKQGCIHVLRRDGEAHAASLSTPLPTLVQALAAITMISTSTSAEARRASTVARAGAQPAGNHSLHTAFIAAKSASMSFSQICALSSFERS